MFPLPFLSFAAKNQTPRQASSPSPSLLRKSTSPKGRGLGKEMKFAWTAKGSPFEERLPPRRGKMSRSDKRGNLAKPTGFD